MGVITRPDNHPITLLRALSPGCFPDTLPEKETRREKLPGALLTTEEAADHLAISPQTLRGLCRSRAITFVQPTPHEYRFRPSDLEEYIQARLNRRKSGVR